MKIGVISDTHIPRRARQIPEQVLRGFAGVDLILHAGDLMDESVIYTLKKIAPIEAVAGNMDSDDLHFSLGRQKLLKLSGYKIGLIHGDGIYKTTVERAYDAFPGADCVVFGHSHNPYSDYYQGVYMFNPGSPTDKRSNPDFSYGILRLESTGIRGEIFYFK